MSISSSQVEIETSKSAAMQTAWTKQIARAGDLVILYKGHSDLYQVKLEDADEAIFHHNYGDFSHKDIIGQPFGSKIYPCTPASKFQGNKKAQIESRF